MVAWVGDVPDGTTNIYGRLIDADGRPLTDEIVLSEATAGNQEQLGLADFSDLGEGLVGVAWRSNTPASPEDYDVYSRIFRIVPEGVEILNADQVKTVGYLYATALDRNGPFELDGLNFWIDSREQGLTEREMATLFLDNPEFQFRFGDIDTLSNEEIIDTFYLNALGRIGDPNGRNFWLSRLEDPTVAAGDVLLAFSTSPENVADLTFVETLAETAPGFWDFVG
ncbi:MAG: DUF4214 domain-containing protein [Paracoccaceae bacterium]